MQALKDAGQQVRYYVEVLQGSPTVHSHILVGVKSDEAVAALRRLAASPKYARFDQNASNTCLDLRVDVDRDGWFFGYHVTPEATPQTRWAYNLQPRKGRFHLGELGGDRVRMSEDLERALLRHGMEPFRRTYAKRLPKA